MTVTPFLTFAAGNAEAAARFYTEIFPDSSIENIAYVENDGTQDAVASEKTVQTIAFTVAGSSFVAMDMAPEQVPAPSWANSYLVELTEVSVYDRIFDVLSAEGDVMMSQDDFGPYQKVCWITDKFQMTWQLVCLR